MVHESNSENDLTSSNSDFEQEKLLNVYVVQIQKVMSIVVLIRPVIIRKPMNANTAIRDIIAK